MSLFSAYSRQRLPQFILLAVLVFIAYSFMLQGAFKSMDDHALIIDNENIRSFAGLGKTFSSSYFAGNSYYRPLILAGHTIEYHFWGLNPLYYYLTNMFVHIAVVGMVFLIAELLIGRRLTAFFVALLFAIHPIHWEQVSNVSGRAILLCAFFYLSAFWLFCLADRKKKMGLYALSAVCFVLALLCKESAVMLPVLLVVYKIAFSPAPLVRRFAPANFFAIVPFVVIDLAYVVLRKSLAMTNLFYWPSIPEAILGFLSFLRGTLTYLRLFIFPVDLHFDRARPVLLSFADPQVWMTVGFYAALVILLAKFWKRLSPVVLFFIVWFFVELFPVCQLIVSIGVQPGFISLAEHFLYTPSVGAFALMVLFFEWLKRYLKARNIVSAPIWSTSVAGLLVFLFLGTVQQNIYSSNEIAMFEQSVARYPYNVRVRNSLALAYAYNSKFDKAEEHFRKVIEIDPFDIRGRIGLAKALCDQGRYEEGIAQYEQIPPAAAGSMRKLLNTNLQLTYKILQKQYQNRLQLNPQDSEAQQRLEYINAQIHSRFAQ